MTHPALRLEAPPFGTNAWVVPFEGTEEAWVVDPSGAQDRLVALAEEAGKRVTRIVLTHGHLDHWLGAADLQHATGAPAWLDERDRFLLDPMSGAMFGLPRVDPPEVEPWPGDEIPLPGGGSWRALHTPGHSPGHRVLIGEGYALVGDLVFMGSIGRMDLPGGDPAQMRASLDALFALVGPDYDLLPGHGPPTTAGTELARNPFLQEGAQWH